MKGVDGTWSCCKRTVAVNDEVYYHSDIWKDKKYVYVILCIKMYIYSNIYIFTIQCIINIYYTMYIYIFILVCIYVWTKACKWLYLHVHVRKDKALISESIETYDFKARYKYIHICMFVDLYQYVYYTYMNRHVY